MAYKLVTTGSATDLAQLDQYEDEFREGDSGMLEVDLRLPVSQGVASSLEDQLRKAGVEGVRVVTASPRLKIYFNKGFPWLAVIAAIILGMLVIAILVVGWRLFKQVVPEALQPAVGTFLLIAAAAVVLVLAIRGPPKWVRS